MALVLAMLLAISESAQTSPLFLSALFAIGLALVHLYSGKLRFLESLPRSRWLSAASGVSVAYVFVHILPDLSEHQEVLSDMAILGFLEYHVYLMALIGLAVFYGLEQVVRESQDRNPEAAKKNTPDIGVFWLHIASFVLYNALIGYLLVHREEPGIRSLFFFFIALGLHFVVNDNGLRADHKKTYHNLGRWILAAAVIVGWVIGVATKIDEAAIAVLFAFIAGGMILNVLKEELPEERQSRFWAFAAGAGVYSVLLLAL